MFCLDVCIHALVSFGAKSEHWQTSLSNQVGTVRQTCALFYKHAYMNTNFGVGYSTHATDKTTTSSKIAINKFISQVPPLVANGRSHHHLLQCRAKGLGRSLHEPLHKWSSPVSLRRLHASHTCKTSPRFCH